MFEIRVDFGDIVVKKIIKMYVLQWLKYNGVRNKLIIEIYIMLNDKCCGYKYGKNGR